jgi:transmembrane sensor
MHSKEDTLNTIIEFITCPASGQHENSDKQSSSPLKDVQSSINWETVNQYVGIWQSCRLIQNDYNTTEAWNVLQRKTSLPGLDRKKSSLKQKKLIYSWAAAASVTILVLLAGIFFPFRFSHQPVAYSEYYVPYGSRSKITLPDDTQVWLNAGSKLRYASDFNITCRNVTLVGEAFFEVARNPQKPFSVKADKATVKVLGTKFNLKAYPEDKAIETTVSSGIVEVYNSKPSGEKVKSIVLKANEQACLIKHEQHTGMPLPKKIKKLENKPVKPSEPTSLVPKEGIIVSRNIDPEVSSSWKENEWIIQSEKLVDFSIKMERRFNIKIHFADQDIQDFVFSGRLKDENLDQMLEAISKTAPISYKIKNADVYLSNRKTK